MKNMMKAANGETIILIDEFGTGNIEQQGGNLGTVLNAQSDEGKYAQFGGEAPAMRSEEHTSELQSH